MPSCTSEDWKQWNAERQRYCLLNTQGFGADIASLEAHIKKLKESAPRDKAGWPDWRALRVLDQLQEELAVAEAWVGSVLGKETTPSD